MWRAMDNEHIAPSSTIRKSEAACKDRSNKRAASDWPVASETLLHDKNEHDKNEHDKKGSKSVMANYDTRGRGTSGHK